MENQYDFKLAGNPWGFEEDQRLIKEYNVDKLNLLEICKIHKRNPGGITSRLNLLNLIDRRQNTRGYSEYLASDLYKELQAKKSDTKNKVKKENTLNTIIEDLNTPLNEVHEMRNEIADLKKDVKEILRLMNLLYDFESQ